MKVNTSFTIRAALVVCAAGALGAFGACKDATPPVVPPPPPPPLAAPTNLTATAASATKINLAWAETEANETGFRIDRCSGPSCTNFAEVFATAANVITYSDSNLTASTAYSYRVRAFNATATSDWTATATTTTLAAAAPAFVMVGAAEITSCAVGQSVYADCFTNSGWGRFLPRMKAAVSQRDFAIGSANGANGGGANAVYGYLGDKAGAPNGYYSYDVGTNWHVIVLNTATWQFANGAENMTNPASAMRQWLTADLAANTKPCTMAIFSTRRFHQSGTTNHVNANVRGIFRDLYVNNVDLIVTGTDKIYERYAPQDTNAVVDAAKGIRQFIVGTGGRSLDQLLPANADGTGAAPNVEARDASTQGVLKLTLEAASYKWDFIPTLTGGFTDTGTTNCH